MISAVVIYKDGKVGLHSAEAEEVNKIFPPGFYEATTSTIGIDIHKKNIHELHLPYSSKAIDNVINTVDGFFKEGIKEKVEKLNFLHKIGILLSGKQGTGKTSLMHFIAKRLEVNYKAIVFFCNTENSLSTAVGGFAMCRIVEC